MKKAAILSLTMSLMLTGMTTFGAGASSTKAEDLGLPDAQPALSTCYTQFPLGHIKPQGWLEETLMRQRNGLTGQLDELYSKVTGSRNGWLGGDGDQWERGPYWIDGLLPLAYILDDGDLKAKVQPWIEWTLQSQQPDGQFGPVTDYPAEKGLQRRPSKDWWPRMVMLKIMRQYYEATGDVRVPDFLTKYFHYQLETLPGTPLNEWTHWALYRQCDNMSVVLWLYSKTGDKKLLELADLLHSQGFDFTGYFEKGEGLRTPGSIHCVNLAQGFKEPVVYWQKAQDRRYLDAVYKGMDDLMDTAGYPTGMYGADETLRDGRPTNGTELCAVVEYMYSLEEMMRITGDTRFADMLERVTYNALPVEISDDFMTKQYFQQVNQISIISGDGHNFDCKQQGTALDFGFLNAFPCCLCNFHQGWPKYVQNLWLKGGDGSIAAMTYGPSRLETEIGGLGVTLDEQTCYPMLGDVSIQVLFSKKRASCEFSLALRIPNWCKAPVIKVNGEIISVDGPVCRIERNWKHGDMVELSFPMEVNGYHWYERSIAIERGPLVYALKMDEQWRWHDYPEGSPYGEGCWEVVSDSPWNYALPKFNPDNFEVSVDDSKATQPWFWNVESAPIQIRTKAKRVPWWQPYGTEAGPMPWLRHELDNAPEETITLIPYGCTTLRITEFPELAK